MIGFAFFLICGLVLNTNWILTTLGIGASFIGAILLYTVHYGIVDVGSIL